MVIEWVLGSVVLVSLVSLVGVVSLALNRDFLQKILLLLVSFAAGAMLGDAFLHLIPEAFGAGKLEPLSVSLFILSGIVVFFVLEKIIHWHHCHTANHDHHEVVGTMNLIGDALHNFIDGAVIAGSYLVSIPLGVATTMAVILHELPQEFSDFGVLLHAGFSREKALLFNFLSALSAILGALVVLFLLQGEPSIESMLIPFTAGGFIYIALADLLPELRKEERLSVSAVQAFVFILGLVTMAALLLLE